MSANGISHLPSREQRQVAKLNLAADKRQAFAANASVSVPDSRYTYDLAELPTKYSGNVVVDNANSGGLIEGRPWN